MHPSIFRPEAPGEVVSIGSGEFAFIPKTLPPDWDFPVELWPLLAETKQQMGVLEGIGRNLPSPDLLLRPLGDREAILSSRLEGTYASARELLLFDLEPKTPKSDSDPAHDHREVFNYRMALKHGSKSVLPLSNRLLKEMHQILLQSVRGRDRTPGRFRTIQVAIGANSRFVPPPPERLVECLDPLEKYLHIESSRFDPLVDCFLVHYQFETIHPFVDGNGRVGRLLLALMLQQHCGLTKPWLYMSEYFDRHRDEYVEHLFHVSLHGDWRSWIEFCLVGALQQTKETIHRCERLRVVREDFFQRIADAGGKVRLHQIVETIFHSPFVRIADLPERLNVSYPTARKDIQRLVDIGILQALSGQKSMTFYAPEVFNIAYEKLDNETL